MISNDSFALPNSQHQRAIASLHQQEQNTSLLCDVPQLLQVSNRLPVHGRNKVAGAQPALRCRGAWFDVGHLDAAGRRRCRRRELGAFKAGVYVDAAPTRDLTPESGSY